MVRGGREGGTKTGAAGGSAPWIVFPGNRAVTSPGLFFVPLLCGAALFSRGATFCLNLRSRGLNTFHSAVLLELSVNTQWKPESNVLSSIILSVPTDLSFSCPDLLLAMYLLLNSAMPRGSAMIIDNKPGFLCSLWRCTMYLPP